MAPVVLPPFPVIVLSLTVSVEPKPFRSPRQ
jgi:hypothetical protein